MLRDRLDVSERWACRVVGQHRSTERYEPKRADDDAALRVALRQFSADHPRWGYRRAHHQLRQDGWSVNRKRVQGLWRAEGLRVPERKRNRRRLGDSTIETRPSGCGRSARITCWRWISTSIRSPVGAQNR
jgi:putative transposase